MIVRNEWVSFKRYHELVDGELLPKQTPPPLRPDDLVIPDLVYYSGAGPSIRYRVTRRVPRRNPHDWGAFEFNLEDVESWLAWAASALLRSIGPPASTDP